MGLPIKHAQSDYDGCVRFDFGDMREVYQDIAQKLEEADIGTKAFKTLLQNAINPTGIANERIEEKFGHYTRIVTKTEDGTIPGLCVVMVLKELPSMDPQLCRVVKDKTLDILTDFALLYKLKHIVVGKNREGQPVMKFVYKTEAGRLDDNNEYDEETKYRTTWGEPAGEDYIRHIASFLSGEFNVPVLDELN